MSPTTLFLYQTIHVEDNEDQLIAVGSLWGLSLGNDSSNESIHYLVQLQHPPLHAKWREFTA